MRPIGVEVYPRSPTSATKTHKETNMASILERPSRPLDTARAAILGIADVATTYRTTLFRKHDDCAERLAIERLAKIALDCIESHERIEGVNRGDQAARAADRFGHAAAGRMPTGQRPATPPV